MFKLTVVAKMGDDLEIRPDAQTFGSPIEASEAAAHWIEGGCWPAKVHPQKITITIEQV